MAEVRQFLLPDVGEGLTEAEIVTWLVKEGDPVAINDVVVEVETAKSIVELPSPFAGVVTAIHVAAGATAEVGSPIISIGDPLARADPAPETVAAVTEPAPGQDDESERHEVLVGYGPTRAKVARRPRRPLTSRPAPAPTGYANPNNRPYAPPPVRKMAQGLGVDLSRVLPSGSRGQITRADLAAAALTAVNRSTVNKSLHTAVQPEPTGPAEIRIPIKGVRKVTAQAMVASAFTAPHVTEWVTVDVTRTLKLLDRMRTDRSFAETRLSPMVLVMRAVLLALARFPAMNATWDGPAGEIVQFREVNLGIAAATPRGLLVPNIKDAQALGTLELAAALGDLISRARAGKTAPERMRDGTFTITNIGVFGIDGGTPILNPGEAGILCFGQIRRRPWEHKGRVRLRSTTTLALSFDHRLIDGELGSKFLAAVAGILENPDLALTW